MIKSKIQALIILFFSFLILSVGFYNCAPPPVSHVDTGTTSSSGSYYPGLPAVNYFRSTPPASFAGEPGFTFILKEYFSRHCGACHDVNGMFSPRFAEITTPHDSYLAALQYMRKDDMIIRITDNPFCKPGCTLDPRGPMYQAIIYWLDHR